MTELWRGATAPQWRSAEKEMGRLRAGARGSGGLRKRLQGDAEGAGGRDLPGVARRGRRHGQGVRGPGLPRRGGEAPAREELPSAVRRSDLQGSGGVRPRVQARL